MPHTDARDVTTRLATFPLFRDCTGRELTALARAAVETGVPAGWTLMREETAADACYVVLEGDARVIRDGQEVARISAGDVVGEMALVGLGLRNATVSAITPLRLLHIDSGELARLVPSVRTALLSRVEQRAAAGQTTSTG